MLLLNSFKIRFSALALPYNALFKSSIFPTFGSIIDMATLLVHAGILAPDYQARFRLIHDMVRSRRVKVTHCEDVSLRITRADYLERPLHDERLAGEILHRNAVHSHREADAKKQPRAE